MVRICRACYTVLPRREDVIKKRIGWPTTALECFFILLFVAFAAWLNRANVSVLDGHGGKEPNRLATIREEMKSAVDGVIQDNSSSPSDALRQAFVVVPENDQPVMSQAGHCTIRQVVHNPGIEAVPKITLNLQFRDSAGNVVRRAGSAGAEVRLGAGETREVTFSPPCPQSAADVRISVPTAPENIGNIRLLTTRSDDQEFSPDEAKVNSYKLVVLLRDLTICPSPKPCQLPVDIEGGRTTTFQFQRSPIDRIRLTSDDGVLIAYLEQHKVATLRDASPNASPVVTLSYRDLVAVDKPNPIISWFGQFFQG